MTKKGDSIVWIVKLVGPVGVLIFVLLGLVHCHFDRFFYDGYTLEFAKKVLATREPTEISPVETLVLGDSTAMYNVDPARLEKTISIAVPHAPIMASFYKLENMYKIGYSPKKIIFSNSYDWIAHYGPFFWKYIVATGILRPEDLEMAIKRRDLLPKSVDDFYSLSGLIARSFYYRTGVPLLSLGGLQFAMRSLLDINFYQRKEALFKHKGRPKQKLRKTNIYDHQLFNIADEFLSMAVEDDYLKALVELAEANGAKFYYVFFPYGEGRNLASYERFLASRKRHVIELLKPYKNVVFLDYEGLWPDSMFEDCTHLNLNGAIAVTNRIRQDIGGEARPK